MIRLYAELTAALLLVIGFVLYRHSLIVDGERICEARTAKAVEDAESAAEKRHDLEVSAVKVEALTYAKTINAPLPVGPPVILRYCPAGVPKAARARFSAHAEPSVPEAPRGNPAKGPDIGPELRANDRQADAQVAGLQSYIKDVCLK